MVLDDVYLELDEVLPDDGSIAVGQEIRFKVIFDGDDCWVIVGIGE